MGEFESRIARLLKPGGGRPLTDPMVAEAQAHLGVRLPDDLLALLRIQNGGYVRHEFRACPLPGGTSRWDYARVEEVKGIGPRPTTGLSLLDSPDLNEEWDQPRELVLLTSGGHEWVALDYRACGTDGEPPVIHYDNDAEPHREAVLAPSFRAFVERLEPEPELDEDDLPPPDPREHLAALAQLIDPPYRSHLRRALSSDAVRADVRAELRDFADRLDERYATRMDPAEARDLLVAAAVSGRAILFHAEREPFGAVLPLGDALAAVLAGGGGIVSSGQGRLALYVSADGAEAVLMRRPPG